MSQKPKEAWKDIPNFENCYQASSLGKIRRIKLDVEGNITSSQIRSVKGPSITLRSPDFSKTYSVSSLIYNTFFPDKRGQNFSYKDGDRFNRRVSNFIHRGTSRSVSPFSKPSLKSLKNEIWMHVPNFEGYYQISSLGRIKKVRVNIDGSLKTLNIINSHKHITRDCLTVQLAKDGRTSTFILASLLYDTFTPEKSGQRYVFKDENSLNVTLSNLKSSKGYRRLDETMKKEIKASIKSGESFVKIGKRIGISRERVRQISNEVD